jgi:hypothetical protein
MNNAVLRSEHGSEQPFTCFLKFFYNKDLQKHCVRQATVGESPSTKHDLPLNYCFFGVSRKNFTDRLQKLNGSICRHEFLFLYRLMVFPFRFVLTVVSVIHLIFFCSN